MLACEQAFRGDLAVGRKKEGELATTSLEFEYHLQYPCGSPSTELSDLRQSARSKNERECKQTRAKGNDVITNIISANQHFESILFDADIQIPETKLQALFSFPAPQSLLMCPLKPYVRDETKDFLFLRTYNKVVCCCCYCCFCCCFAAAEVCKF